MTGDPVRFGLVSSLAHPGGNITGVSVDAGVEIWGKRLELLAEAVPKLTRLVFVSTKGAWVGAGGQVVQDTAKKLGIALTSAPLSSPINEAEYGRVISSIQRDQFDGIMLSEETENYPYRILLVELIQQVRLPAIYSYREQVEAGGFMSYSWDMKSALRRNAKQVAEYCHGARSGRDTVFSGNSVRTGEINLKTAKELGVEIPVALLAAATAVLE